MTRKTKSAAAQPEQPAATSSTPSCPDAGVDAVQPLPSPQQPKGKLGVLVGLLSRPEGARIQDLAAATGWQVHSVRGAIAGALKKDRGLNVVSTKTETGRTYRIAEVQS